MACDTMHGLRRRDLGPLVIVLISVAILLPILFGRSFWLRDIVQFTYPMKTYLRERLLAGELPLWNPRAGLGRPFFGTVQPGVLYPLNVVLLLPVPRGLDLFMALHLPIAALGMRRWLRALAVDPAPAAAGGLVFALSGYMVALLAGNGVYAFGSAWVPWVLAAAARDAGGWREGARTAGRTALLLALCLSAGDPQALWFALGLLFAQALAAEHRRRALAVAGGATLLALACAAVQLLPALDVAAVGRPGGVPIEDARHFALHPARLFELFWPGAFGTPHTPGWFIHALVDEGTGRGYEPLAASVYMGLATPFLAIAALASPKRRPIDWVLAGAALLALLVSFGELLPLWRAVFRFVPGARMFRYPEKYVFVFTLCLAALAARGLPRVIAEPRRSFRVGLGLLALLGAATLIAQLAGAGIMQRLVGRLGAVTPAEAGAAFRTRALVAVAIGAATLLPLGLAARGRLGELGLARALGLTLAIDLAAASLPLLSWAPSRIYRDRPPIAEDLQRAGFGPHDRLYRPLELDITGGADAAEMTRMTLTPNCGWELGLTHLDNYDVFHTPRETLLWSALRATPLRLLQVTATRFALVGTGQLGGAGRLPKGMVERTRYPRLGAALVEVEGASPRVYLSHEASPATDGSVAADHLRAAGFVPGRHAAVEGGEARSAAGDCTLDGYVPTRITLHCTATAPAYAVVNDAHFPGWRATVDGSGAPILPANVTMRAIPIPAGQHTVVLTYHPRGLRAGLLITLLALALAALAWLPWPRPRSTSTGSRAEPAA